MRFALFFHPGPSRQSRNTVTISLIISVDLITFYSLQLFPFWYRYDTVRPTTTKVGWTTQVYLNQDEKDRGYSILSRAKPYDWSHFKECLFDTVWPWGELWYFRWIIHILRIPSSGWRKERKKKSRHLFYYIATSTRKKRAFIRKIIQKRLLNICYTPTNFFLFIYIYIYCFVFFFFASTLFSESRLWHTIAFYHMCIRSTHIWHSRNRTPFKINFWNANS